MKRHFIALAGIDGSGKTTQARILIETMQKKGLAVHYVWNRWEPLLLRPFILLWKRKYKKTSGIPKKNYSEVKKGKQGLLRNPLFRSLWLTMFFLDYALQVFFKVRLGTMGKKLVISDRVFYDSVIDQAVNLGEREDILLDKLDAFWMRLLFPKPDLVIYVDCPAEVAFARKDDAPSLEYLEERRRLYLMLARRYKWTVVDGSLAIEGTAGQVLKTVSEEMGQNG